MARICTAPIVENDDYVQELLAEAFDDEGFEFTTVETGTEMESCRHYLFKPFRIRELIHLIDEILALAAAECLRRQRRDGSHFPTREA